MNVELNFFLGSFCDKLINCFSSLESKFFGLPGPFRFLTCPREVYLQTISQQVLFGTDVAFEIENKLQ